jgi:hypothetical protein
MSRSSLQLCIGELKYLQQWRKDIMSPRHNLPAMNRFIAAVKRHEKISFANSNYNILSSSGKRSLETAQNTESGLNKW